MNSNEGNKASLSAQDLVYLNEEIAAMARAGLPLEEGLQSIAREMAWGNLKSATLEIQKDLSAGKTLPEALALQKGRIPPFYSELVNAGIQGGSLPQVLSTLTTYARSLSDLRSLVITALFYPFLVMGIAIGLFTLILVYVIPQFESIFRDFGMQLPSVTRLVLSLASNPLYFIVLPCVVFVAVLLLFRGLMRSSETGACWWTRLVYSIPVLGTLIRTARLAAFTDLLGILVEQHLPLPQALRLAGDAGSDPFLRKGAREIATSLEKGESLQEALKVGRVLPDVIVWMAGVGEMKGNLASTLRQAAQMYRRQVEMRASLAQSIIPPFLIVGIAAIITGLFVLAIFMPLVKLLEGLSK